MKPLRSFYFSDEPYLSVLKGVYQALRAPEAFVKLLGQPRTGKSTLCEKLSQFLERKGQRVCYINTAIESPDMLRSLLARQLDLPDSANFARLMEDALADIETAPLVLIFDDAHLLTDITLIEISRLAEVQKGNRRLINVLLCGEPVLSKRLASDREFKSLLLHVSHSFTLEPMGQEAVQQFLRRYGERAGQPALTLEADALSYFYKTTRGFPGSVISLSRSLLSARVGAPQPGPVTRSELLRLVQEAPAMELPPSSGLRASTRRLGLVPLAAVVIIVALALLYQRL